MKNLSLVLFICLFYTFSSYGQKIIVNGSNWIVTAPTLSEAGSNYSSSFIESIPNQTSIDATAWSFLGLLPSFKVFVHKVVTGTAWPAELLLSVRRTSGGNTLALLAALSGGVNYQVISNTSNSFFQYGGLLNLTNINNISIQYKIEGISVLTPISTYSATVYYTITE